MQSVNNVQKPEKVDQIVRFKSTTGDYIVGNCRLHGNIMTHLSQKIVKKQIKVTLRYYFAAKWDNDGVVCAWQFFQELDIDSAKNQLVSLVQRLEDL